MKEVAFAEEPRGQLGESRSQSLPGCGFPGGSLERFRATSDGPTPVSRLLRVCAPHAVCSPGTVRHRV